VQMAQPGTTASILGRAALIRVGGGCALRPQEPSLTSRVNRILQRVTAHGNYHVHLLLQNGRQSIHLGYSTRMHWQQFACSCFEGRFKCSRLLCCECIYVGEEPHAHTCRLVDSVAGSAFRHTQMVLYS